MPREHSATARSLARSLPLLVVLILVASDLGCSRPRPMTSTSLATATAETDRTSGVEAALEPLRSGDITSLRNVLKQVNALLSRPGEQKPPALTKDQQAFLTTQFGLDSEELAEVSNTSFTLLDAPYLDQCLLLRDAARSLQTEALDPVRRATVAFGWLTRQVRLQAGAEVVVPPPYALRRSYGNAADRSLAFLALLQQLGIDGCLVVCPDSGGAGRRPWLIGALVGQDISLFDPRLGLPLPGPGGKGVATWSQVRSDPKMVNALTVDKQHAYDVTPEQARQAEIRVGCFLSALAPRMRQFEQLLAANNRVMLAVDPAAVLRRFQQAAHGAPVKGWGQAGDPSTPIAILRSFLPAEDGGADRTRRKVRFEAELIPWGALPPQVSQFREDMDPGRRLRVIFQQQFLAFFLAPNMPRDLILRGRLDEATAHLVAGREQYNQLRQALRSDRELEEQMSVWADEATRAYADLLRAERAPGGARDSVALEQARRRVERLWKENLRPVTNLMFASAAEPLGGMMTYNLALAKHEAAERLQAGRGKGRSPSSADQSSPAREAWQGAAAWWETFLTEFPTMPPATAARELRARALAALGQTDGAVSLLEDLSGKLSPLEVTSRLYQARQLKAGSKGASGP
jgi:hypothetical protein